MSLAKRPKPAQPSHHSDIQVTHDCFYDPSGPRICIAAPAAMSLFVLPFEQGQRREQTTTAAIDFARAVSKKVEGRMRTITRNGWRCQRLFKVARNTSAAFAIVIAASALITAGAVQAQDFPGGRPIEMTVMFGAGSAADVTARYLAEGMAKTLGVPVPVVNRTGGGGAIGYSHVQQQKPDGHAIIWNSNSISTNYHSGILSFDYKAFDAVARVSVEIPVIAVRSDSPWKSLQEFLDYAKANPGKLRIGNSGTGSHTHFAASALFLTGGAKVINVPFGEGQAIVNLLGSRIEGVVQLPAALVSHVKGGNVRILAALGSERDPVFPDVPTAKELGFPVALDMWRGIAVPDGTPKPVIAKLQQAIKDSVQSPGFADAGKTIGFTPAYLPADDFGSLIASDDAKLAQVMGELGLKKK
jgi:putative tricarboxylic transport membrane protein